MNNRDALSFHWTDIQSKIFDMLSGLEDLLGGSQDSSFEYQLEEESGRISFSYAGRDFKSGLSIDGSELKIYSFIFRYESILIDLWFDICSEFDKQLSKISFKKVGEVSSFRVTFANQAVLESDFVMQSHSLFPVGYDQLMTAITEDLGLSCVGKAISLVRKKVRLPILSDICLLNQKPQRYQQIKNYCNSDYQKLLELLSN